MSILKRKGLLDKSLDARSIKPSKYLKSQLKRFSAVLRGEASPVKVSRESAAVLKKRGFTVKNGRAVVPHQVGEKVRKAKGSFKVITPTKGGGSIEKLDLALDPDNVAQWIEDLENNRFKIKDDELLAFQFKGYNSNAAFGNTKGGRTPQQQMADVLMGYDLVKRAEAGMYDEQEVIDGITIFKIKRGGPRPVENPEPEVRDEETRRKYRERARLSRQRRLNYMSDKSLDEFRNDKAEAEKKRRTAMTDEQKAAYKAKAAERAKKSREAKKNKGV